MNLSRIASATLLLPALAAAALAHPGHIAAHEGHEHASALIALAIAAGLIALPLLRRAARKLQRHNTGKHGRKA